MFDENPNLIQDPRMHPWDPTPPLVLIHDGGGTIFSYYLLGSFDRPLYGIFNPNYGKAEAEQPVPGGIPEMARHYAELIRGVIPRNGSVILGGWSLGGMLSLQVAHELARSSGSGFGAGSGINVLGIVMVDSVCPLILRDDKPKVVQHVMQWGGNTRQETKDAISRCFDQAFKMVQKWTLPRWDDDPVPLEISAVDGTNGAARTETGPRNGFGTEDARRLPRGPPPPVIMLRAKESVPVVSPGEGVSRVDVHREDELLGWGQYRNGLIHRVDEVPGHHFNIFATEEHLTAVTKKLSVACQDIVALSSRPRP
jgi:thioesterase domain-containing protein